MRSIWTPILGLLAALSGCAPPPADQTQAIARPIVNGTSDTGDPSMVEFLAINGTTVAKCTATLVSPHVLLTAAHCIAETKGFKYAVFPGPDDSNITAADLLHVQAAGYDPKYNGDPSAGHDLAVVVLVNPLSAPIIPLNRTALTDKEVGQTVRYVGYGLSSGTRMTGDGIKRQASAPLGDYNDQLLLVGANPHNTCEGDSGGPLLMDTGKGEAVAGVTSFGTDKTCLKDSYFQRIDTQTAWIDQMIAKYDGTNPPTSGAGHDAQVPEGKEADGGAPEETDAAPTLERTDAGRADGGLRLPDRIDGALSPRWGAEAGTHAPGMQGNGEETVLPTATHGQAGGCAYGGSGSGPLGGLALLAVILAGVRRRR